MLSGFDYVDLIMWNRLVDYVQMPTAKKCCMLYMAEIPRNNQHARMSHAYAKCYVHMPQTFIKEAQIQLQQMLHMSLKTLL